MSSTSDVAFLLLIFAMLAALAGGRREAGIERAEARAAPPAPAAASLEIWIGRDGAVRLDGQPASLALAGEAIAGLGDAARGAPVRVVADRDTPYRNVSAVLEILQLHRHQAVSLAVRNVE